MPGATLQPLLSHAGWDDAGVRRVIAVHEAMASAMADGLARRTGRPGVAMAIGGPGAWYLSATAALAVGDDVPVLYVTGDGGDAEQAGRDARLFEAHGIRSFGVWDPVAVPGVLAAVSGVLGVGGAAHLVLGMEVQGSAGAAAAISDGPGSGRWAGRPAVEVLSAPRVALAVGHAALGHGEAIRAWSAQHGVPVLTDMTSRGVVPEGSALSLGHVGFMPHPRALAVLRGAGGWRASRVVALGCGPAMRARLVADGAAGDGCDAEGVAVVEVPGWGVGAWLAEALAAPVGGGGERRDWVDRLGTIERAMPWPGPGASLSHAVLVADAMAAMGPDAVHVVDAGQFHQVAPAMLRALRPRTILTPSGLAGMGWSLGAAMGAAMGGGGEPVVAYVGDGSFLMHGLELATAARHGVRVLFLVAANGVHGSVRRGMGEAGAGVAALPPVEVARLAEACGVEACVVWDREGLARALGRARNLSGPLAVVAHVPELDDAAAGMPTGLGWLDARARKRGNA